jgi:hypothetical protein
VENQAVVRDDVAAIMGEFIDQCDEYLMCLSFAVMGLSAEGEKIKKQGTKKGQQIWIASDTATRAKFHARMDTSDFIEKSKKDGFFSNELGKSLLCLIYTLWDETYRHRIATVANIDAGTIIAPLMGDLRKIRHCVIHDKSEISEKGMNFEVLTWPLAPGKLVITQKMFNELNDHIRRNMNIHTASMSPKMKAVYDEMTEKERKSFDDFYKKPGNKANDVTWPGLAAVLSRIKAQTK